MKRCKKWIGTLLVSVSLITVPVGAAMAANSWQILAYGTMAMVIVKQQLVQLDAGRQNQMLAETQKKTGVSHDEAANQRLDNIHANLMKTGMIKRDYKMYVNPSQDMNAFETIGGVISINQGMMNDLTDSELAFTLCHEMGHGEHRHAVNGILKGIAVSTAVDLAFGGNGDLLDILFGGLAVNYIDNEVITMDQEKEADATGFNILKNTQYNVGGAPASMVLIYEKYGNLYTEGWKRVISPNNHPKMSNRIERLGNRMTRWSGNRVQVGGATVYVNALPVVTPISFGEYSSCRRAYLVAGNLARLTHEVYGEAVQKDVPQVRSTSKAADWQWNILRDGSDIVVNGTTIMTCAAGDDQASIIKNLKLALYAKADMLNENKISSLQEEWLKTHGYKEKKKETLKNKNTSIPAAERSEHVAG